MSEQPNQAMQDPSENRVRLTFELTPDVYAKLVKLRNRTGCASHVEVVRRALSVYDVVTEFKAEGGKLEGLHADGTRETIRII